MEKNHSIPYLYKNIFQKDGFNFSKGNGREKKIQSKGEKQRKTMRGRG